MHLIRQLREKQYMECSLPAYNEQSLPFNLIQQTLVFLRRKKW